MRLEATTHRNDLESMTAMTIYDGTYSSVDTRLRACCHYTAALSAIIPLVSAFGVESGFEGERARVFQSDGGTLELGAARGMIPIAVPPSV